MSAVLHSPLDGAEMEASLRVRDEMGSDERERWEAYGDRGGPWDGDGFDEYPEEAVVIS